MAKKVFLSPSDQSGNTYAAGNTCEQVQCERITGYARIALERSGVEVKVALNDQADWKAAHVTASNNWHPDLHVAVHTNAANGKTGGVQVYYGAVGAVQARTMFNAIKAVFPDSLPHSAEGINGSKTTAWVEFNSVNAYTLYLETNFHDVPAIASFIVDNVETIGEAIAHGICDVLGVPFVEPEKPQEEDGPVYRVQVGAFRNKDYAEAFLTKVKKAGFDNAFITEVK